MILGSHKELHNDLACDGFGFTLQPTSNDKHMFTVNRLKSSRGCVFKMKVD